MSIVVVAMFFDLGVVAYLGRGTVRGAAFKVFDLDWSYVWSVFCIEFVKNEIAKVIHFCSTGRDDLAWL